MSPHFTSPGVYIEEIPSTVHTISGVSTNVGLFVDTFQRGPDNTPTLVSSFGEFERTFGGLSADSAASYSIFQFFQNGGGGAQAWVIRVSSEASSETSPQPVEKIIGKIVSQKSAKIKATANPGAQVTAALDDAITAKKALDTAASNAHGVVDPNDPKNVALRAAIRAAKDKVAILDSAIAESGTSFDDALSAAADLERLLDSADEMGNIPSTLAAAEAVAIADGALAKVSVNAKGKGTFGNNYRVKLISGSAPNRFSLLVGQDVGADPLDPSTRIVQTLETYHNLSTDPTDPNHPTQLVSEESRRISVTEIEASEKSDDTEWVPLTGGVDSTWGTPESLATAILGDEGKKTGIYAMERVAPQLFNLMCLPAVGESMAASSIAYPAAVAYCVKKRAFLILDIPEDIRQPSEMLQVWQPKVPIPAPYNEYAAVYFPRLNMPDPLRGGRSKNIASSGAIAGLYARTDSNRGVQKSPAGTEAGLLGATVAAAITDTESGDDLNQYGFNAIRSLPAFGNISWGARTLAGSDEGASEWKYLSVRRTFLFIEQSLFEGLKWVVFEPNDEPLWSSIRLNVGSFMLEQFRNGMFQGSSPEKAFFVRCDDTTTTQDDIDRGIVNIEVGFAPLKPAEFVVVKISQKTGA